MSVKRDQFEKIIVKFECNQNAKSTPDIGQYNPHYDFIAKSYPKCTISKLVSKEIFSNSKNDVIESIVSDIKSPKQNLGNYIKFDKQLGRKSFVSESNKNGDEKRFELLDNSPQISSKYKKIQQISFDKVGGRPSDVFVSASTSLMYAPNFTLVDKSNLQ